MIPKGASEGDLNGLMWFAGDVEHIIRTQQTARVAIDLKWGIAALLSLAVLWAFAPSGLWLLLFIVTASPHYHTVLS